MRAVSERILRLAGAPEGFEPAAVVRECIESGARALLLDRGALPPAFFDLSTRVAGDLVHRITLYGIPMAAVVPDVAAHSPSFQDFAREANRGAGFRFVPTAGEAEAWLTDRADDSADRSDSGAGR